MTKQLFLHQLSENMSVFEEKVIDEAVQGAAFNPFAVDENVYAKHFYIESYGCAMNFNDTEIVASILYQEGFGATKNMEDADLILLNTCSIRDKAEQTVRNRLKHFSRMKRNRRGLLIGVLGCMAERLKSDLLEQEQLVDMVIGPDAYRTLPHLIAEANGGQKSINVLLSREETYADISPVRLDSNGVSSFVSIMRGCNNMCSFCVVPFTRGRERSRDAQSIVLECQQLIDNGYKEITLLGQNVDSYQFIAADGQITNFAQLLQAVALLNPSVRIRFSTSHPKDITDDVLHTMGAHSNICKCIHLPVQSGSSRVLQLMNRTYTKEWYMAKVDRIREILPTASITSDLIIGFCTETEEELQETIDIINYSQFDYSYMYTYSERDGTLAARRYADDIPDTVKADRIERVIAAQRKVSYANYQKALGTVQTVLVEGPSKKNPQEFGGRADNNRYVIFANHDERCKKGDFVQVRITEANSATLKGDII
jgi:tRNA-2-methylthio-N6-dimethylallyladenosine synthase